MRNLGKVLAVAATLIFVPLALLFLALTAGHVLGGGQVGTSTIAVGIVYAVGLGIMLALWVRVLRKRDGRPHHSP